MPEIKSSPCFLSTTRLQPEYPLFVFLPPETDRWRLSLLREFSVDVTELRHLTQPMLVIASALDRLLPSVGEAKHLINTFPNAQMTLLPKSGHACLLETDVDLYKILQAENFLDSSAKTVGSSPPAENSTGRLSLLDEFIELGLILGENQSH